MEGETQVSEDEFFYERRQLTRVQAEGPGEDETMFRFKVWGKEMTKTLSVTPEQLARIITAVCGEDPNTFPVAVGEPGYPHARVQATGEFRPPRAGEWFLSGAIIEGYRAKNNLGTSFNIAKLVEG